MQRIVNGGGQIEREYALWRKRTDLLIKWRYTDVADGNVQKLQQEVIELKIVHAKSSLETTIAEGVVRTAEYMDTVG